MRRARTAPRQKVERKERIPVVKSAIICIDGADMNIECTLRDIHNFGARFSVANPVGIPDEFLLISRVEDLCARAKVAWRRENEMGVRFLRRSNYADEDRMRQEQQKKFAKTAEIQKREKERMDLAAQKAKWNPEDVAQPVAASPLKRADQLRKLGLDPNAKVTSEEIKRAFRAKAMTMHPDRGGDPVAFQALSVAYSELTLALELESL